MKVSSIFVPLKPRPGSMEPPESNPTRDPALEAVAHLQDRGEEK